MNLFKYYQISRFAQLNSTVFSRNWNMVLVFQAAAASAETHDVRAKTITAGSQCGTAYKILLEQVNMVCLLHCCYVLQHWKLFCLPAKSIQILLLLNYHDHMYNWYKLR